MLKTGHQRWERVRPLDRSRSWSIRDPRDHRLISGTNCLRIPTVTFSALWPSRERENTKDTLDAIFHLSESELC